MMAKMIPGDVEYSDFNGSYGEMEVFKALKSLPEEYVVFHSVHWNKRNKRGDIVWGESDFTVFHPKRGLLVIEVKSGGIQHFEGKWKQMNTLTNEEYPMKDPMVQAERSKYTFADLISKIGDEGGNTYWVEAAVWFPSVETGETIGALPPAYGVENVLLKGDLNRTQISIEKLFDYYNMYEKLYYDKEDAEYVLKILSPQFDAIPSMAGNIIEQDHYFNRMTLEQGFLIDYLEEQRHAVIQGGAGTGKTMLAIEKARRLPKDENILFLCFNKYLLAFLKDKYAPELLNVDFYNLPSLVCSKMNISDAGGDVGISDYLNKFDKYGWSYKHILIDEGQDFTDEHLELMSAISELQDGCFYVFYDKNQRVQQRQSLDWANSVECRLVLSCNCRNTKNIATTSNKAIGIEKIKMRREIDGQKPSFYITKDQEHLLVKMAEIIRKYTDNGVLKKQITILTVKTEETSVLSGINNIGTYHITSNNKDNGIFFTSARKFKGLESDVIIMVDVDQYTFENDESRRVFYVGTSRAKHWLDFAVILDEIQLSVLAESLSGEKQKNAKLAISSALKVRIVNN